MNWTQVPVYRGITQIKHLISLLSDNDSVYILGGYVRYCASPRKDPHPAQDIDLFFENEEAYDEVFELLYKQGFRVQHDNDQAATLKYKYDENDDAYDRYWAAHPTIQLVKPQEQGAILTLGSLEDILSNFDFTVVRVGFKPSNGIPEEVTADEHFIEDEENAFLRLRNIHCPVSSTLRAIKYGRKGYWMNTRQAFKLFADWDDRSQDYRDRIGELIDTEFGELSQKEIEELEALLRID